MRLGNIVSKNKITAPIDFNVVTSIDDIDAELPTLVVGYDYVNKNYPDFDILDISLSENVYWTFKRTEKRDKFEKDLSWFISKTYNELVKDLVYISVDPIQQKKRTILKIIRKIYSLNDKVTYIDDNMVFIYSDKLIFSLDLKLYKFIGINTEKLINKLKNNSRLNVTNEDIGKEEKDILFFLNNKKMYVPFLIDLKGK
jgi:hypothetical protein